VPAARDALLASPAAGIAELVRTHAALTRLGSLSQVVVAAIDGDALAGGCELALACDLRVMAEGEGRIGLVEVSAAIPPGAGGTQRLARAVGPARARSMMLRATTLDARSASSTRSAHRPTCSTSRSGWPGRSPGAAPTRSRR
jgi:enoyl-CoA hydratase/carnithine racemase